MAKSSYSTEPYRSVRSVVIDSRSSVGHKSAESTFVHCMIAADKSSTERAAGKSAADRNCRMKVLLAS
jgi:hypothetical protein